MNIKKTLITLAGLSSLVSAEVSEYRPGDFFESIIDVLGFNFLDLTISGIDIVYAILIVSVFVFFVRLIWKR